MAKGVFKQAPLLEFDTLILDEMVGIAENL